MKNSAEIKKIAQYALADKWKTAILAGFIATLLGSELTTGNFRININLSQNSLDNILASFPIGISQAISTFAIIFSLYSLTCFIIGGAIKLGYSKFNLDIIDGNGISVKDIFSRFDQFGTAFCLKLLTNIYVALWSLLFIIPGIIKTFSYAMAPYILCEDSNMSAKEALKESEKIMDGHKWQLFCLNFSFIGWTIVSAIPFMVLVPMAAMGFGGFLICFAISIPWFVAFNLYVVAYKEASYAAFYREITNQ